MAQPSSQLVSISYEGYSGFPASHHTVNVCARAAIAVVKAAAQFR